MSKRIFSILLILAMMFSAVPVFADDSAVQRQTVFDEDKHENIGDEYLFTGELLDLEGEFVSYTANSEIELTNDLLAKSQGVISSGTYYLADDLNLNEFDIVISENAAVSLDLAGHILTGTGRDSVIYVSEGASFTLSDSKEGGCITGGTGHETQYNEDTSLLLGGAVMVCQNAHFEMLSGQISGNSAYNGGAILLDEGSSGIISGGCISYNEATYGVIDIIHGSSLIVCGDAKICNNTAEMGSGIYGMGSLEVKDNVVISENYAIDFSGGICAYGTLKISGNAKIINNRAGEMNAGIYAPYGVVFGEGNPVITGNTVNGENSNLCLFGGYGKIEFEALLGKDAKIGISNDDYSYETWSYESLDGIISTSNSSFRTSAFFADSDDCYLYLTSDMELAIESRIAKQPSIDDMSFEVNANDCSGSVSYQWYKEKDGIAEAVETPRSAEDLEDLCYYYCKASLPNGKTFTSDKLIVHIHVDELTGEKIIFDKILTSETDELTDGNYFLAEDIRVSDAIYVEGNVNLCLCGNVLVHDGDDAALILSDYHETVLNIYDCKPETLHIFEEDSKTGKWNITGVFSEPELTQALGSFDDAILLSDSSSDEYIDSEDDVLLVSEKVSHEIYGGVITLGKVTEDSFRYDGGAIYIENEYCTVNMYGGNIVGNLAYQGGAVYNRGNFNMYGGSIQGNIAYDEYGGVINDGNMTVGGNAVIANNKVAYSGEDSNLKLYNPVSIAEGEFAPLIEGDDAMNICITPGISSPVILTNPSDSDVSCNIKLDTEWMDLVKEECDDQSYLTAKSNYSIYLCSDGTAHANSIDGEDITYMLAKHYYVFYDGKWYIESTSLETSADYSVVICDDTEICVSGEIFLGGSKDISEEDSYYGLVLLDGAEVTLRGYGDIYYNGELILENGGRGEYDQCTQDTFCVLDEILDLDPKAWYHDGIHYVIENYLMDTDYDEDGNCLFNPADDITKGDVLTILWQLADCETAEGQLSCETLVEPAREIFTEEEDGEIWYYYIDDFGYTIYVYEGYEFDDVYESIYDEYYTEAARFAVSIGLISDEGSESLDPEQSFTREEVANVIYKYEKYRLGEDFEEDTSFEIDAKDSKKINEDSRDAMSWCVMKGIFIGNGGKLNPTAKMTRAEFATVLMRYMTSR